MGQFIDIPLRHMNFLGFLECNSAAGCCWDSYAMYTNGASSTSVGSRFNSSQFLFYINPFMALNHIPTRPGAYRGLPSPGARQACVLPRARVGPCFESKMQVLSTLPLSWASPLSSQPSAAAEAAA